MYIGSTHFAASIHFVPLYHKEKIYSMALKKILAPCASPILKTICSTLIWPLYGKAGATSKPKQFGSFAIGPTTLVEKDAMLRRSI
jgi:hypothetical protein